MVIKRDINRYAGTKLRALRQSVGISQATLGKEIGVTGQQIQKYESGINCLSIDKLHQLAELFEVSTGVFFPAQDANRPHEAIPPASARLIKMMNRISEEYHEPLYTILRALVRIVRGSDPEENKP